LNVSQVPVSQLSLSLPFHFPFHLPPTGCKCQIKWRTRELSCCVAAPAGVQSDESGRYGQASGRPVLDLRRLERGTRPGYQCCSRGEACLQGRWRSGPPTSTSTSSILCHCEHPHYSPFSVSSCI